MSTQQISPRPLWASRAARGRVGTPLSPPQRQILALLAAGLRNDQIAGRVGIRPATAHHHLDALYRKRGVHSRTQAVVLAYARGLIELEEARS